MSNIIFNIQLEYLQLINFIGAQPINKMETADKIFTNLYEVNKQWNGQTLTLKMDQTFHQQSKNSAWDSSSISWNWDSFFSIDGVWSYDQESKTITLTATKYKLTLQQLLKNEEEVIAKGFPDRVVSTPNFSLQSPKEINAFEVYWEYSQFRKVASTILKRK